MLFFYNLENLILLHKKSTILNAAEFFHNLKPVYISQLRQRIKSFTSFTAVIKCSNRIDRERLADISRSGTGFAWVNITVVARDRGYPSSRSTRVSLHMKVADVNDNSPVFVKRNYDVSWLLLFMTIFQSDSLLILEIGNTI